MVIFWRNVSGSSWARTASGAVSISECIPYWNAIWVHGLADYGTRVVIYH